MDSDGSSRCDCRLEGDGVKVPNNGRHRTQKAVPLSGSDFFMKNSQLINQSDSYLAPGMGGIINISLIFSFFGSSCCAPNACNAWTTQCTMHVNVCTTHSPFKEHNKNWWHMIQVEFIPGFSTVTFFTFIIIESLYSKKLSQTFIKWCSCRCADFQRKKIECVKLEWLVTTTLTHYRLLWKTLCKDKNRIQHHYNYKDDFRIDISLWKHCLWGTPEYQNAEGEYNLKTWQSTDQDRMSWNIVPKWHFYR